MLLAALRLSSAVARALPPAPVRAVWTRTGKYRGPTPYSKARVKAQRARLVRAWPTLNHSALTAKFLRYASRVAGELGVAEEAAAFDAAAAAFPNPPRLVAATLVERSNLIVRDIEAWEGDFKALCFQRYNERAKVYPQELIDMWTANDKVIEKGAGGGEKRGAGAPMDAPGSAASGGAGGGGGGKRAGGRKGGAGDGIDDTSDAAPASLNAFFDDDDGALGGGGGAGGGGGGGGDATDGNASGAGLVSAPRTSSADLINDTRSLDRAYASRLVLLLRDAVSGEWGVPQGVVRDKEPMAQAAERVLRSLAGDDPALDVWYIGNSPVGHALRPYPPALAAQLQCYGERVFYYRAELLGGRFRLPFSATGVPLREGDPRCAASAQPFPIDDFHWLTRDETEAYLPRKTYKYLHQVMGGGAGEEHARGAAWKKRIEARGLTIAQATGRRAHRVALARRAGGMRLPAVATASQAALAALPWAGEGSKAARVAAEVEAWHDRRRAEKVRAAALQKELAVQPRVVAIRTALASSRERRSAKEESGVEA